MREAEQWSRHFDALLWQVTAFLAAAIGGLLVYCSNSTKFDFWLSVVGLVLSVVPVYLAASFRELRARLSNHLSQEIQEALHKGRKLYQWEVYCLTFLLIEILWVKLLYTNANASTYMIIWVPIAIVVFLITIFLSVTGVDSKSTKKS